MLPRYVLHLGNLGKSLYGRTYGIQESPVTSLYSLRSSLGPAAGGVFFKGFFFSLLLNFLFFLRRVVTEKLEARLFRKYEPGTTRT